jgi:mannose-6-phosphate isomerase-like protein (cupin superfamily)
MPFGMIIDRDEAETYWQPAPSHGTMNTILSPRNCPANSFSVSTQYIDEGAMIRLHAHERAEEILFLYEGHGTLTLEDEKVPMGEGSTCLVGRYVQHSVDNESSGTMKVLIGPNDGPSFWQPEPKSRPRHPEALAWFHAVEHVRNGHADAGAGRAVGIPRIRGGRGRVLCLSGPWARDGERAVTIRCTREPHLRRARCDA